MKSKLFKHLTALSLLGLVMCKTEAAQLPETKGSFINESYYKSNTVENELVQDVGGNVKR